MAACSAVAAAGDARDRLSQQLGQAISARWDAAFRRGLSDMGYFEGQNVSVEYRWITDRYDALPAMAADLVQRCVGVI